MPKSENKNGTVENKPKTVDSAAREIEDGTWRNSSIMLDRTSKVAGIYNKNHPVSGMEGNGRGVQK